MMWNIQTQSKVITFEGCITQVYFFILFAELDNFLLTVMAYISMWPSVTPCTTQSS